ncbi:MAG: tyrosine--tRNA ligase, partial [Oscillospiraceae bacterium]
DDQWSNMLAGTDLIRRKLGKDAYAMTITLLLNSEGKKMGKTQKGAVWLDPAKTSPFEFFQYWRNIDDNDVIKCLKMLTFIPLDEIKAMEAWEGTSRINEAKEILAFELTKLVHDEEEANKALDAAKSLFSTGNDSENIPTVTISTNEFTNDEIGLLDLLVKTNLLPSKGEARRLVQQGGITIDDVKVDDATISINKSEFDKGSIMIKKGKKSFNKVIIG